MKYTLRVIDFETSGIPNDENEHCVVEAAYVDVCAQEKKTVKVFETLVIPENPINIESLAVHHITEKMATEHGKRWPIVQEILSEQGNDETIIYVAHNADFEKRFFNPDGSLWIDTYKVALNLYQDAPRHTNQVIKYYLGIEDRHDHHPPHRALPDCVVTAAILLKMAEQKTFNDMVKISKQPPYLTRIAFGKHKGERFEDLPVDYRIWLKKQRDLDEGVKAALDRVAVQGN